MTGVWIAVAIAAVGLGGAVGALVARRRLRTARAGGALGIRVGDSLRRMNRALETVTLDSIDRRGGWDRDLFETVLDHLEREAPVFQAALAAYLSAPGPRPAVLVERLLAVDRLAAAYTIWTRLFPPRRQDASMFVLSLLHDLGEQVQDALGVLEG